MLRQLNSDQIMYCYGEESTWPRRQQADKCKHICLIFYGCHFVLLARQSAANPPPTRTHTSLYLVGYFFWLNSGCLLISYFYFLLHWWENDRYFIRYLVYCGTFCYAMQIMVMCQRKQVKDTCQLSLRAYKLHCDI